MKVQKEMKVTIFMAATDTLIDFLHMVMNTPESSALSVVMDLI